MAPKITAQGTTAATRHQVHIERLKAELSARTRKIVARAPESMIRALENVPFANLKDLKPKDLQRLISGVQDAELKELSRAIEDLATPLKDLATYEAGLETRALKQLTTKAVRTLKRAASTYAKTLEQPMLATGERFGDFLKGWSQKEIKATGQLISKGYASGMTNQQMVQALRGTKALNYADGIAARLGRNADTVVHTAVQTVASDARAQVWAANSDILEGYQIVATLDGETTQICRSLDKTVHEIGKGPMPPFHYGCRTTTAAVLKKQFASLSEGATRSSENGPVDAKQSYYGWLKDQPSAFQDSAIGPVRGQLFRDGGLSADEFARLNLGRNFQPLTLDQMKKLEPLAFEKAGL